MVQNETQVLAVAKTDLWAMLARQQAMALNLLLGSLELQREYRNKAETDALTGLHNRVWSKWWFNDQ